MKSLRSVLAIAVIALMAISLSRPARADMTGQQVWQKCIQRIRSMKDYTLLYNYSGHKGEFKFEYSVVRPNEVKTRIVQGKDAGAILIYNTNEYGNEVRARKGMLGKGIALNDPKVANSPVIQPVFDMLLDKVRGATNVQLAGSDTVMGHVVYMLNITAPSGTHIVAVDKQSHDVLRWKYSDSEGSNDRVFYNIQVNSHPRISF